MRNAWVLYGPIKLIFVDVCVGIDLQVLGAHFFIDFV